MLYSLQKIFTFFVGLCLISSLSACGYNTLEQRDERVKMSWSQLQSVYQKRTDLIPNLVKVVQAYAAHERSVFVAVTEARAKASVHDAKLGNDEGKNSKFLESQKELSAGLSRLIVVAENYPQLKADQNFQHLQAELVQIENQIVAARNRYTREVMQYNNVVRSFPTSLTAKVFGHQVKNQLSVEDEGAIKRPPEIKL
jgi:LemA protein